jgi:hypothetical protein
MSLKIDERPGWIVVSITAGLVVSMAPETAEAYAAAKSADAQRAVFEKAMEAGTAQALIRNNDGSVEPNHKWRLAAPKGPRWSQDT